MKYFTTSLILRLGLAFVFLYAGIDALREPAVWVDYVPDPFPKLISQTLVLDLASYAQILMAAALLWRPLASYAALLGAVMLLGITFANLPAFLIVFRDLGLAFMAVATAVEEWPLRLNIPKVFKRVSAS